MTINRLAVVAAALSSLLLLTSVEAATKYYKWVDAGGVIHYGENPPDPSKAQIVNVHTGTSSDQQQAVDELEKNRAKQQEDAKKQAESGKTSISDENAQIVKDNCDIYKQNLSALKSSPRIREKDASGEYRYLTDEEKASRTQAAEDYIKEHCS